MTMAKIVEICSERHTGGENYFNELDRYVKNNDELLISMILYISELYRNPVYILSGEIGIRYIQLHKKYPEILGKMHWIIVNGSLRKGRKIDEVMSKGIFEIHDCECIFLDDSFYSGKTFSEVKKYIGSVGGEIRKAFVFYDGSPEKFDFIESLYRYYE